MKKILAVILSLAMILGMNVCAFAAAPLPTNTEADWAEYFTEVYKSDVLDTEGKANALAVSATMTEDVNMLLRALKVAIANAEAAGVDTTEVNIALKAILAENGLDLEAGLNKDVDGDGYLGDPAKGVLYVPTDATDVEAWTLYYTILLSDASSNPGAVIEVVPAIANTVIDGKVDMDTFTTAFGAAAKAVGGDVVNQIVWGVESLLNMDLNSDSFVGKPTDVPPAIDDGEGEGEGEGEGDSSADSGFDIVGLFDTVLGVVGGLFDSLLGGLLGGDSGSDEGEDEGDEDEDMWGDDGDAWGDEGSEDLGDDFNDSSLGDTSVIAVAAVALAAGAALVLTRKKSEDAE